MSFHEDQVHSTLEAVSQQDMDWRMRPLPINQGMQVVPNEGIQLASDPTGMEATIGAETVANDGYGALSTGNSLQANIIRPRKWRRIALALVIFISASVLKKTGVSGKNGSAIAAAVSRPNFPLEFHIFYLDAKNLIHDAISNTSTDSWSPGALSTQGYTAMPNSSLTATYNQCRLCANTTLIAFQDKNGFVQVGNLTSEGWTLEQLGPALDPAIGTGLALQPFYLEGLEDQINLYYQKRTLNMSLASWKPAAVNNGMDGWSLDEQIFGTIPPGSPIAAASSFSNESTGYETWIEILFLSSQGIQVSTWSGAIDSWLQQNTQPSALVNSSNSQKVYGDLAVTSAGNAFGVVMVEGQVDAIESYSVERDLVDWNSTGTMNLGGAWG